MAQNFSGLNRQIIGSVYYIGNKKIIDRNCNINIPSAKITTGTGLIKNNLTVCGKMLVNTIEQKDATFVNIDGVKINDGNVIADTLKGNIESVGTVCANVMSTNYLFEKKDGHGIILQNNSQVKGNLQVTNQICGNILLTDYIFEKHQGHGIVLQNNSKINGNLQVQSNICVPNLFADYISEKTLGHDTIIQNDTKINGNLCVNGHGQFTGNLCVPTMKTNYIKEKELDHGVTVCNNMTVQGNVKIAGSRLNVDQIMECTTANGVCIGPLGGFQTIATTIVDGELGSVTGDAVWQCFEVLVEATLTKIDVQMCRLPGFANTPMKAIIYQGCGTGGMLIGQVCSPSYNGGIIDFSFLGLALTPGLYTLQMDYPPNNLSNYQWIGHETILGEPSGGASNLTLHLEICTLTNGGVKVNAFNTCVKNILKLEFPSANCQVEFTDANIAGGECDQGYLQLQVQCDGNSQTKTISFDASPPHSFKLLNTANIFPSDIADGNVISWQDEQYNYGNLFDSSASQEYVTIQKDGVYQLETEASWCQNGMGYRFIELQLRGNGQVNWDRTCALDSRNAITGKITSQNASCVLDLRTGDALRMVAGQTSGGPLDLEGNLVSFAGYFVHALL